MEALSLAAPHHPVAERRTVEAGVAAFHCFYVSNWPYQMAAATAAALPLLLVFRLARRYFIRGIQLTGFR